MECSLSLCSVNIIFVPQLVEKVAQFKWSRLWVLIVVISEHNALLYFHIVGLLLIFHSIYSVASAAFLMQTQPLSTKKKTQIFILNQLDSDVWMQQLLC